MSKPTALGANRKSRNRMKRPSSARQVPGIRIGFTWDNAAADRLAVGGRGKVVDGERGEFDAGHRLARQRPSADVPTNRVAVQRSEYLNDGLFRRRLVPMRAAHDTTATLLVGDLVDEPDR